MRTTSPGSDTTTGTEQGTGHRVRAIAADANIDPSMVMRYLATKINCSRRRRGFDLEFPDLSTIDETELGAGLVNHFMNRWERDQALIVSSRTNDEAVQGMREIVAGQLLPGIAKINPVAPEQRAMRVATEMLGAGAVPVRPAITTDLARCRATTWWPGWGRRCSAMS